MPPGTYDPKTTPWSVNAQDFPHDGSETDRLHFLLRYALLAASSHNTQPWQFVVQPPMIHLWADPSRWLRVADADRRELHISIGCALENLLIAADYFGYASDVTYLPYPDEPDHMASVCLTPAHHDTPQRAPALFAAIPMRHTNHKVYDDTPIPVDDVRWLEQCVEEEDITLLLTDDSTIKQHAEELITEGDARQFANPAYREELGFWIGQGVFGAPWLLAKLGQLAVTYVNMGKMIGKQDRNVLLSAPVLGVLATPTDDPRVQVRVGQAFERLSLAATARDIRLHPMSQPMELPDLRERLSGLLPVAGVVPQHAFRLGYAAAESEHTPRRPLEEVINLSSDN
jgi:nitroreductase